MSIFSAEALKEGQILLFDKPYQWTSFDLVNKIRILIRNAYDIKKIKVGHAGTLDPLATGLMVVCIGKATKKIETLSGLDKDYIATIELGASTPTYDLESQVNERFSTNHINETALQEVLTQYKGEIDQTPPIFSAIKVKGKKAYELARKGQEVELKSRKVVISKMDLLEYNAPELILNISCSKGTYIRSLAHDIGKSLNSGGHLTALKRTRIGEFYLAGAITLEEFEKKLLPNATN